MENTLYAIDQNSGKQIDLSTVSVSNTTVTKVIDSLETEYKGDDILLINDRDFLYVPDLDQSLTIGDQIYLDNQSTQRWEVHKGWYSVDDNPAIYGWYLTSIPAGKVRSLFLKDFNSMTFVTPKTEFTLPTVVSEEENNYGKSKENA